MSMTEIRVDGIKLIKAFSLLNFLFKAGDQAKVFKIYGDGETASIEATTSVYFKCTLCPCSEVFEQMVSFSDIVPFIDNDTCLIQILPETVLIESSSSSIALQHAFGEIYRLDISDREWKHYIDCKATTSAFEKLEKLTDFRNAYKESKGIVIMQNIIYSVFPSAWFFLQAPSNGIKQMLSPVEAKLLCNLLSKDTMFSMDSQHIVFRDAEIIVAIPRHEVEYQDPKPYEENAIYLGELDVKKLHESLKSAARLSKTAMVDITTIPASNKLLVKVDVPGVDIAKKFDFESSDAEIRSFRLMLGFLQSAFVPFQGKVGVYYCQSKTPLLMLKSQQVKCLLSLIS